MRNFVTLTRRELLSVFVSPLAYVTASMFLFVFGLIFFSRLTASRIVSVETLIDPMGYVLPVLLGPVLTMRLLAEERRMGTLEALMTAPVGDAEVVLSKFAGVLIFYASTTALTLLHAVLMVYYSSGPVDFGSFANGYLGILLFAALFLAFGLLASSCFESPVLAALVSFVCGLTLLMISIVTASPVFLKPGISHDIFQFLMPVPHFKNFYGGAMDTRDVAYFTLTTAYLLFLTTKVLESRKWR